MKSASTGRSSPESLYGSESGAVLVEADIPGVKSLIEQTFLPILFHDTYGELDAWFKSTGVAGGLGTIVAEAGQGIREACASVLSPTGPGPLRARPTRMQ